MTQACNPNHSRLRQEDHKIKFSWGTLVRRSQYKRAGDTAQSECLHMPDVLEEKKSLCCSEKIEGCKKR